MEQEQQPIRVPGPQKKTSRRAAFSRLMLSWFGTLLILALLALPAAYYGYEAYTAQGPLAEKKLFQFEAGTKRAELGAALQQAGVIDNPAVFTAAAYAQGALGKQIIPGEYEFPAHASIETVLNLLSSGKALTYKITIPEGWTTEMAIARINQNTVLVGDIATAPNEGALMADTYLFRRGQTRQKILDDMQASQAKLLDELWAKRDPQTILKNKEEAVVLASIVEKETAVAAERPMVASVFINRLKQGMRLQSDPTTIYGIAGGKGKLDRSLTKADLATETPYNTYRIPALPIGPIANPGRAALEAVLNPPTTEYVYFVANGTGGHAFAKTLDEHNANVAKWRALQAGETAVITTEAPTQPTSAGLPTPPPAEGEAAVIPPPVAALPVPKDALAQPVPEPIAPPPADVKLKPAVETVAEAPAPNPSVTPIPQKKPEPPAVLAVQPPKAGSLVKVGDRLVPIPRQRPKT